jgi:hypothetical protein
MRGVANAQRFGDRTLHGGYGCLTTFLDEEGQLSQLVFDGKGNITSGTKLVNILGEVCVVPVTPTGSSYTVNPDGTGTLTVHLGIAVEAADGDPTISAFCSELSGASEHFAIVVESGGKRVDLSGLDPFFTGGGFTGTGDTGDLIQSGACNRQVGG